MTFFMQDNHLTLSCVLISNFQRTIIEENTLIHKLNFLT
uniref:Uncharacterized protein n=1 Tax=Rhizophora mucronata TaxID=61149 RepID=A0A2P2R1X5_RHIMU